MKTIDMIIKKWKSIKCNLGHHDAEYFELPINLNDIVPCPTFIEQCKICKKTWLRHSGAYVEVIVDEDNSAEQYNGLFRKMEEYKKVYPVGWRDEFDTYIESIYDTSVFGGQWKIDISTI